MSVADSGSSITHSSDRTGTPDLRLIHYNDVYHVEYVCTTISLFSARSLTSL